MLVLVVSQVRLSPTLIVTEEMAVVEPVKAYRKTPVLITPMETVAAEAVDVARKTKSPAAPIFRLKRMHKPLVNFIKGHHSCLRKSAFHKK